MFYPGFVWFPNPPSSSVHAFAMHMAFFKWRQCLTFTESDPCSRWWTLSHFPSLTPSLWCIGSTRPRLFSQSIPCTLLPHNIQIWETLLSKLWSFFRNLLIDDVRPPKQHRSALRSLHIEAVNTFIAEVGASKILDHPPSISKTLLTCSARVALSQLHLCFCPSFISYWARFGAADSFSCPVCGTQDQAVGHVFSCSVNLTH